MAEYSARSTGSYSFDLTKDEKIDRETVIQNLV
jgi:hypothetical protein